ncbi:hypothetical protein JCM11641_002298 [Rhodosporidiobolus odoratus]
MVTRSTRLIRLGTQAASTQSRAASTTSTYKPRYTPRYPPRTAPARTATSPSTPPTLTADAQKTVTTPAPTATPVVAAARDVPTPQPVLNAIPEEFDSPPTVDSAPSPSLPSAFARKPVVSTPEASPAFPPTSLASTSSPLASAFSPSPAAAQPEIDWSTSYHGLSASPFTKEQADVLMRPLEQVEIEIKPDGLLYLPEILYRRILNKAFGPGGWGMVPRGEMTVMKNMVTREWGLVAGGRLVSVARGEQTFFDPSGMPTATEGCKSNALMRCCKDLGIASELWDPVFIRAFKVQHCVEAWTEHVVSKKKQKRWRKKGNKFEYPYLEAKGF